ncbi:ribosome assembly factor SBDS [Candidatus Pacearchaeota archaeon]|nr:ribosome assembly factor SBDS [Candidatus Pacearchaeota archaeon]
MCNPQTYISGYKRLKHNLYIISTSTVFVAQVTARIKVNKNHYEILVDLDEALKVRAGKGNVSQALVTPNIFHDMKKGLHAGKAGLIESFGTDDVYQIAQKIIVSGEVQKNQEYRDAERDIKIKQIVNLLLKNSIDQNGRPYTEERLKRALEEAHVTIDNRAPEQQLTDIISKLQAVIPIKVETKRIKLNIPARYTGQIYSILKDFKESEEWLANGNLQAILNIPAGMQLDFYDRLNAIAHGAIMSEEIKDKK